MRKQDEYRFNLKFDETDEDHRRRMLVRSFSATKDSTCKTMSLRKVPIKSLPRRVSSRGMSKTADRKSVV